MADIARTIDIKHVKKLVANTEIVKTMYEISSNDEKLSYIIGCNEAKNDTAEMLNMRSNTFSATKILVVGDMEFLLLTEVEDLIVMTKQDNDKMFVTVPTVAIRTLIMNVTCILPLGGGVDVEYADDVICPGDVICPDVPVMRNVPNSVYFTYEEFKLVYWK